MLKIKQLAPLIMILAIVASVFTGAFAGSAVAAQPSVQTSSDLTNNSTWKNFNASPSDTKQINFTNADAADGALVVWDPATGSTAEEAQVHAEFDNTSSEFFIRNQSANEYAFNLSGDDLKTVPMEAGENKTVRITIANQSDWTASNANTTTFAVTLSNTMERSVMYVGEYQVQNGAYGLEQTDDPGYKIPYTGQTLPFTGEQSTSLDATRTIDGSNTTVYTYLAQDTAENHFSDNFASLDAGKWSDDTLAKVDDSGVKAYSTSLPSDLENGSTTMRYQSGSTDALVLEIGDDYSGQSTIDVSADSNPKPWQTASTYGWQIFGVGGFSLSMFGVVFASRRRYDGFDDFANNLLN